MIDVARLQGKISSRKGLLVIDNHIIPEEQVYVQIEDYTYSLSDGEPRFLVLLRNGNCDTVIRQVMNSNFYSLSEKIHSIRVDERDERYNSSLGYIFKYIIQEEIARFKIGFYKRIDSMDWKKPWSIKEFFLELKQISKLVEVQISSNDPIMDLYDITFPVEDINARIEDEIQRCAEELHALEVAANASLTAKVRTNAVVTYFDFPEAVKVPCEQYLLYFVQFLKDVGVSATAELQEDAGRVLFAVTPDDDQEALENIRQALDAYLRLPANPNVSMPGGYAIEPAMQQLASNVYHLQSQLALKSAMLQAKDTTIQAQQLIISQQQMMMSGQVLIQSAQPVPITKEDKEELLGGVVALKTYEGEGFDVNIPMIYRWARDLFTKKGKRQS